MLEQSEPEGVSMHRISLRALPIAMCLSGVLIGPVTIDAQTCTAPWLYTPFATCEHPSHGVEATDLRERPHAALTAIIKNLRLAGTPRTGSSTAINWSRFRLGFRAEVAKP